MNYVPEYLPWSEADQKRKAQAKAAHKRDLAWLVILLALGWWIHCLSSHIEDIEARYHVAPEHRWDGVTL